MKKKFLNLSLLTLIIGILIMAIAYFFFHFVTDEGITLTWHKEAGKPFVTYMIGIFGVLNLFCSMLCLLIAKIFFSQKKD